MSLLSKYLLTAQYNYSAMLETIHSLGFLDFIVMKLCYKQYPITVQSLLWCNIVADIVYMLMIMCKICLSWSLSVIWRLSVDTVAVSLFVQFFCIYCLSYTVLIDSCLEVYFLNLNFGRLYLSTCIKVYWILLLVLDSVCHINQEQIKWQLLGALHWVNCLQY